MFRNKKNRAQSASGQKRASSAKQRMPEGMTNEKIREKFEEENKAETKDYFYSGAKGDKYGNFKNEVINDYIRDQENASDVKRSPMKEQ